MGCLSQEGEEDTESRNNLRILNIDSRVCILFHALIVIPSPNRYSGASPQSFHGKPYVPNQAENYSDQQPTGVRYGVMGLLCSLAFVLYIDRICIGV